MPGDANGPGAYRWDMDGWPSTRDAVCPACGASWPGRTARFCGACGAALKAADHEVEAERSGRGPGGPNLRVAAVAGVAVVALGIIAAIAGSPGTEDPPEASADVDLPGPEEIGHDPGGPVPSRGDPTDPADQADPSGAADLPSEPGSMCSQGDCERWRRELPPGPVLAESGWLIHVHKEVGPPTDWPDETRQEPSRAFATLTAIQPDTGEVGWRQELRLPHLSNAPIRLAGIGEGLLVVTWDSKVTALDADSGERRWSQRVANEAARVHPGADGEVVVWHRATVGLSLQELRGPLPGGLTRLDRGTGESLGTLRPARLVTFLDGQAILQSPDDQAITGVGLDDLTPRWERGTALLRDRPPILQADGRVALLSDRGIELIDPDSGETLAERPLEIAPHEVVEVVGTTAIRYRPDGPPGLANAGLTAPERFTVELYDLADPDRAPTRIRQVIGVEPIRKPPEELSVPEGGWPVDRVVIVSQDRRRLAFTVVGSDDAIRSEHEVELDTATCCWRPLPTAGSDAIALLSPDARHRIAIVDTGGEYTTVTDVGHGLRVTAVVGSPAAASRPGPEAAAPLADRLILATEDDPSSATLIVVAANWRFESVGPAELIAADPVPTVRTSDGVIGLNPGRPASAR